MPLSSRKGNLLMLLYQSDLEVGMHNSVSAKPALSCVALLLIFPITAAFGQTACPIGTAAGSAMCGPGPSDSQGSSSDSYITTPAPRPNGEWLKTWGAVAQSPNGDTGLSAGFLSKGDASRDALSKCATWGAADCRVIVTYRNQCVASVNPVDGGAGGAIANASSVENATKIAGKSCEKSGRACKLTFSECSEPKFRGF
ncbi:DUF4189 domain-containing protein [Xanthomonas campestris]|uniref:DUF4189 domain-containing protein n=1 Tax=Xanthomonas campestris TaxID=339 RepID=UPI000E0F9FBB